MATLSELLPADVSGLLVSATAVTVSDSPSSPAGTRIGRTRDAALSAAASAAWVHVMPGWESSHCHAESLGGPSPPTDVPLGRRIVTDGALATAPPRFFRLTSTSTTLPVTGILVGLAVTSMARSARAGVANAGAAAANPITAVDRARSATRGRNARGGRRETDIQIPYVVGAATAVARERRAGGRGGGGDRRPGPPPRGGGPRPGSYS